MKADYRERIRICIVALFGLVGLVTAGCIPGERYWSSLDDVRTHQGYHWVVGAVPDQAVLKTCLTNGEVAEKNVRHRPPVSNSGTFVKDSEGTYVQVEESGVGRLDRAHRTAAGSFLRCMKQNGGYSLIKDGN